MRPSGRKNEKLRALRIQRGYTRHAEGSVLIECGDTRVLCTASVLERVPPHLRGAARGWVTAEYGMLPRSTHTRTAAITGSFVALHDAADHLLGQRLIAASPVRDFVAAVSVGVLEGVPVLDLDYAEDARCDTDLNVVMTGGGGLVEVQGTAEGRPFTRAQLNAMLDLAERGIRELVTAQRAALKL